MCVGYVDHFSFDDKMELFSKSMKYTMLLWDIEDVSEILPALEITSHLEITTFEFHPERPYLLIGNLKSLVSCIYLAQVVHPQEELSDGIFRKPCNRPKSSTKKERTPSKKVTYSL